MPAVIFVEPRKTILLNNATDVACEVTELEVACHVTDVSIENLVTQMLLSKFEVPDGQVGSLFAFVNDPSEVTS